MVHEFSVVQGHVTGLVERVKGLRRIKSVFDFDIEGLKDFHGTNPVLHSRQVLADIADCVAQLAYEGGYWEEAAGIPYYFTRRMKKYTQIPEKVGLHLIFDLPVEAERHKALLRYLTRVTPEDMVDERLRTMQDRYGFSLADSVDVKAPFCGWQMYGSTKPAESEYPHKVFAHGYTYGVCTFCSDADVEPGILSVRTPRCREDEPEVVETEEEDNVEPPQPISLAVEYEGREYFEDVCSSVMAEEVVSKVDEFTSGLGDELQFLHRAMLLVPADVFADDRETWLKIGMGLHHTDFNLFGTWVQLCLQARPECIEAIGDLIPIWRKFRNDVKNPVTKRFLYSLLHKHCKAELKNCALGHCVSTIEDHGVTDGAIAEFLLADVADRFMAAVHRTSVAWYFYDGIRWDRQSAPHKLQKHILNHTAEALRKRAREWAGQEGGAKKAKLCNNAARHASNMPSVARIMQAAGLKACDFTAEMDRAKNLLCCLNGTVDLDKKEFRPSEQTDLCSLCTNQPYVEEENSDPDIDAQIDDFMEKVFPRQDVRDFVWTLLASFVHGNKRGEYMFVFHGGGSNGKSQFTRLLELSLGSYATNRQHGILTQEMPQTGAPNPEMLHLQSKRLLTVNEFPFDTQLRVATMQQMTGKDPFCVRGLFEGEMTEVELYIALVVICNKLPRVNQQGYSAWRRIRAIPFDAKFVDTLEGETDPNAVLKDDTIADRLPDWAPQFMSRIIRQYFKTEGRLEFPQAILDMTKEYRASENTMAQFVSDCIEKTTQSGVYLLKKTMYEAYRRFSGDRASKSHELIAAFSKELGVNASKRGWLGYQVVHQTGDVYHANNGTYHHSFNTGEQNNGDDG